MIDNATKKARAAVLALAASLGATVEHGVSGRMYAVHVEAPRGMHWACDVVHELAASTNVGPWSYADLWQDALDRMQCGVEPCGADCEYWE